MYASQDISIKLIPRNSLPYRCSMKCVSNDIADEIRTRYNCLMNELPINLSNIGERGNLAENDPKVVLQI